MAEEDIRNGTWRTKSVEVLRPSTRSLLDDYFKNRLEKDKERFFEEIGFSQHEIAEAKISTAQFINVWSERCDLDPSISRLVEVLQSEGHQELIDIMQPSLVKDIEADDRFLAMKKSNGRKCKNKLNTEEKRRDKDRVLTIQDVNEMENSKFNALLCGSENPRIDRINERLKESGVKLCDLRRDILPGTALHPAEASIIQNRAPTLLLMIDKQMLADQGCSFQMIMAHFLDPDARCSRWIPIKLEADVELPTFIKHGNPLDFSTDEKLEENWETLLTSIKGCDQRNGDANDAVQTMYHLKTMSI